MFCWQTAGLDITSTVEEIDAPRRIVWGGPAQGIVAVHVWTFEPWNDGVLVRTAESWEGDPVTANVETMQGALDEERLRAWLEYWKHAAEERSRTRERRVAAQDEKQKCCFAWKAAVWTIGRMTEFIWSQYRIGSAGGRSEMDALPLARGHSGELGASRRGGRD